MKKINLYLILFLLSVLIINCESDDNTNENNQNDLELTPETIVLNDENSSNIISMDENEIIFNNQDSVINQIEVNDIIVSGISDNAPNGFLKRVTSIDNTNNQVKITATDAKITDAIKNGSVSFNETIDPNDVVSVDTSGEELNRNSNFVNSEFSFEINRTFDLDGDSSTVDDRIKFEGDIDFNPSFEFDIDIINQEVDHFLFKLVFSNTTSLKVEYDYSIEHLGINKTYVLKTVTLSPTTIWIGSFPLVLTRRVVFVSGIDGEVRAQIIAEASNTYTTELGIEYNQNSGWQNINNQSNVLDGSLTAQVELSLEGWVQPRLEMRPYGVNAAKIFLAAKGGLKGELIAQPNTFDASLKFTATFLGKAQMNIFSSSIVDYEQEFWSDEFPIWSDTFSNGQVQDLVTIPNGTPVGLALDGNDLYIGDINNAKIHRLDISQSNPTLTDFVTSGVSFPGLIEISDNKLYVPQASNVSSADITQTISNLNNIATTNFSFGAVRNGNDLYTSYRNEGKIVKFDLTQTNPTAIDVVTGLGNITQGIALNGNDLYIARSGDSKISKIDITQTNPNIIDVVTGVNPIDLLIVGNDLYFSGNDSVQKIDITETNPTPIVIVDGLSSPVWGIEISNNILYMAQQSDNKILSFGL
ncbi:hypothetical protein [Psychroserpens mesophilus]|uniref:hypothetical protein n=1 Tax=Psychroserpens mesophilus TaxID=325473 RepID=UPI003D65CE4C